MALFIIRVFFVMAVLLLVAVLQFVMVWTCVYAVENRCIASPATMEGIAIFFLLFSPFASMAIFYKMLDDCAALLRGGPSPWWAKVAALAASLILGLGTVFMAFVFFNWEEIWPMVSRILLPF